MGFRFRTFCLMLFALLTFNLGVRAQPSASIDSVKQAINSSSNSGDYVTAFRLIKRLIFLGVTDSSTYFSAALVLALEGDKESGLKYLDTAVIKGWADADGWPALTQAVGFEKSEQLQKLYDQVKRNAQGSSVTSTQQRQIHSLYLNDQNDRLELFQHWPLSASQLAALQTRDSTRRSQVYLLLNNGKILKALDFLEASTIMLHGEDTSDYATAHKLADIAVAMGSDQAKFIVAASIDRYLIAQGKDQEYGTQAHLDPKTGKFVLYPVSNSVTDADRKALNVPPLRDALKQYDPTK